LVGLRTLHNKGMVEGMFNCTLDFDFCEHSIYGKQNRVRFPSGATREKGVFEISLTRLIKIFATVLMLWRVDLIHWGFLDAF
jgi:hypothetical protein